MSNKKLLEKLRDVYGKYTNHFELNKEQVFLLLGKDQNVWSGLYKEGLIKDILKKVLPEGIEISSGFIYGFDEISNSKQIDIIVWDSLKHSAIFKTDDFVILSPESVIAIIEVKTNKQYLIKGLENLSSIIPLDYAYKLNYKKYYPNEKEFKPISKYLIFYKGVNEGDNNYDDMLKEISKYYCEYFDDKNNINYKNEILEVLNKENELNQKSIDSAELFIETLKIREELKRYYPRLILNVDDVNTSFYFGMGENPNNDSKIKWIPNVYKQNYSITTPFEKFVYYLLEDIYDVLKIRGISMLCGWGDISPKMGYRGDDISELDDKSGLPTIDL